MLERLIADSRALEEALDNYLQTVRTIRDLYVDAQPITTISPKLAAALAAQFSIIGTFKEKLDLTKRVAGRSMNTSSSLVPIHMLPSEILTCVFKLALDTSSSPYHSDVGWYRDFQMVISVCSYWHQVAFDLPDLWTHIDLQVTVKQDDEIDDYFMIPNFNLAKFQVTNCAQMRLDVHIIDDTSIASPGHSTTCTSLVPFIASIAPRVRSLIFEAWIPPAYRCVLTALFNNCTPGKFSALVTRIDLSEIYFLDTKANPELSGSDLLFEVDEKHLDEVYQGMTVLELGSVYPRWSSMGYRGPTELRLKGGHTGVTERQLVEALKRCPGLRVLECAIHLTGSLGIDEPVDPIPLNDLEVVNLGLNEYWRADNILRWLAPGAKPLQLSITEADFSRPHLVPFLARSNITKLYLQECDLINTSAMHCVHHLPRLQTMVLAYTRAAAKQRPQPCYRDDRSENVPSSLETLYILDHHCVDSGPFQGVLSLKSLRHVVFYCCNFGSPERFLSELSLLNPRVDLRIVPEDEFNPAGEWELFSPKDFFGNIYYF
ncbi:hypothetical protein RSAG8_04233, partial [Rhizoctonia solani AG-8 WAC10335]